MSVGIYRAIGGISLNGREWVLNDDNEIMKFNSHEDALKFLIAKRLSILYPSVAVSPSPMSF